LFPSWRFPTQQLFVGLSDGISSLVQNLHYFICHTFHSNLKYHINVNRIPVLPKMGPSKEKVSR
ncbi:unnamed protein product, partial [Prunus brigantina]